MPLTGKNIDENFDWKVDKSFSAYISNAEKNRLFRNTLINLADKKYMGLNDQKTYDELSVLFSTEAVFQLNNNRLPIAPLPLTSIVVTSGTYTVVTFFPHNLIIGDVVTMQGLTGNYLALNGLPFTVTSINNANQFQFQSGNATFAALLSTGQLTSNKMCADYLHHFASKTRFVQALPDVVPVSNSYESPIRIKNQNISSLRSGEQIVTSGFPIAGVNGTFYAKVINTKYFDLYLDAELSVPSVAVTAGSAVGGVVSKVYEFSTMPVFSDRKIDPFADFDIRNPGVEFANKQIKVYPLNRVCTALTMDYMKIPETFIDVNDNVIDLELIYPTKLLYRIIAEAALLYSSPSRDQLLQKDMQVEILQNP